MRDRPKLFPLKTGTDLKYFKKNHFSLPKIERLNLYYI